MAEGVLGIFIMTYLGLALGKFPGLMLDRTGFALLGAVACLGMGAITMDEAKAAIDGPTLAVLFGMMILSAQYRLSGLYTAIGERLARLRSPRALLLGVIFVSALLAAVLTNDVVCFAMAPLLLATISRTGWSPLPFLLALACATNIGSALTPIGNPQNILIAQRLELGFAPFIAACVLPVILSLGFLYALLSRRLRPSITITFLPGDEAAVARPFDRPEAIKAIVLTVAAIGLFISPVPAALSALSVGGVVLTSPKMKTREMLGLVDWQLLTLFAGLFIVVRSFELAGWTDRASRFLEGIGADLTQAVVLTPIVAILSNLVSNVPAVMLVLPFVSHDPETGYSLALASTLAGNAIIVSSIANIIVVEQAARYGTRISFREHMRVGLPVTLASLAFALIVRILATR